MVNGELYYVPNQYFNRKALATMPMIRKDVLDKLGLKAPTNYDELFEVLKAIKKANPNAARLYEPEWTRRLLFTNAYSMGSGYGDIGGSGSPMYYDKDVEKGKWLYGPLHPEFDYVVDSFAKA